MLIIESATQFVTANLNKLQFARTFNRNEPKGLRTGLKDGIKGIYLIFPNKANPLTDVPYYVGETGVSIKHRTSRHRKSLKDPLWHGERTGDIFTALNIDLDQDFDVWYITSEELGITSKKGLIKAECDFILYYGLTYEV